MNPLKIYLVKPHPGTAILKRGCPTPEIYKYNWEPVSLKYIAGKLKNFFQNQIHVEIWHLMNYKDDKMFLDKISSESPNIVAFSEIDILLNEVNRLAKSIKYICNDIWTVVGGKHTSLLRVGDKFPFRNIDFAIRGDGAGSLIKIVQDKINSLIPSKIQGLIQTDKNNIIVGFDTFHSRGSLVDFNGISMQSIHIENHSFSEYISIHQKYPSIQPENNSRTVSVFIGSGCPHRCYFCQSPIEYGDSSAKVIQRAQDSIAQEIIWLSDHYGVNNFFSLEPNLDLKHLYGIYNSLERFGVDNAAISGFVRASDVVKAYNAGVLQKLKHKGLRILSIGLDIPFESKKDIYNKSYSYKDILDCLEICEQLGIVVLATIVATAEIDAKNLIKQLEMAKELPVSSFDIRIAIALRNTKYFEHVEDKLIFHPDKDNTYYDRQNYRYQTIQFPGKIRPYETYDIINNFYHTHLKSNEYLKYISRILKKHPDTEPFFQKQLQKNY